MTDAAFFDLDRTLLWGASGRILSEALRQEGLVSQKTAPIERVAFGIFELIGETLPSMLLTRQGARGAKGWERARVQAAAERAADALVAAIQPYALPLIEQHKAAGRQVVLATTTPYDLVAPLIGRLGLDAVLATRYAERDGRYTGDIDGLFVWGKGKRDAVRNYAAEHSIDLRESYAYSDSYYDLPLLNSVGNPTAVNPDPRLTVIAAARRWPTIHFDVPPGVPKFAGWEPQRVLQVLARPELFPGIRFQFSGLEHIPAEGPAIVVANHRSYFDPVVLGLMLARVGRPVRFLGKREVFDAPIVGDIATAMGGIPVDRGSGSDEPLQAAASALAAGDLVALMPQGTIPRGPAFFDPKLVGRWGAVKLADLARVPVIPVGMWGTEAVWPRSSRVPNLMQLTNPPKITVTVGPPVKMTGKSLDKRTAQIMSAITELLPAEAREHRIPTEAELARTYPSGKAPTSSEHEASRRPGTD